MTKYLVYRGIQTVLTILAVSIIVFGFMTATGDAAGVLLSPDSTFEDLQRMRHTLGLDQPLYVQYAKFMTNIWHGDSVRSFQFNRPVFPLVMYHMKYSVILVFAALALGVIVSIPLGTICAYMRNSPIDVGIRMIAVFGQAMPFFWVAMLLIMLFSVKLHMLPAAGVGLKISILPIVSLSFWQIAVITRLVRNELLEVLSHDYIRTARSKGLSESTVLLRHALKNAGIPVVTITGIQLAGLLGGAVVTETIFAWPGVGWLLFEAISARDYPVVVGGSLIVAIGVTFINLAVDITYGYLDPRVRAA